jgi:hypothetical protein
MSAVEHQQFVALWDEREMKRLMETGLSYVSLCPIAVHAQYRTSSIM